MSRSSPEIFNSSILNPGNGRKVVERKLTRSETTKKEIGDFVSIRLGMLPEIIILTRVYRFDLAGTWQIKDVNYFPDENRLVEKTRNYERSHKDFGKKGSIEEMGEFYFLYHSEEKKLEGRSWFKYKRKIIRRVLEIVDRQKKSID